MDGIIDVVSQERLLDPLPRLKCIKYGMMITTSLIVKSFSAG